MLGLPTRTQHGLLHSSPRPCPLSLSSLLAGNMCSSPPLRTAQPVALTPRSASFLLLHCFRLSADPCGDLYASQHASSQSDAQPPLRLDHFLQRLLLCPGTWLIVEILCFRRSSRGPSASQWQEDRLSGLPGGRHLLSPGRRASPGSPPGTGPHAGSPPFPFQWTRMKHEGWHVGAAQGGRGSQETLDAEHGQTTKALSLSLSFLLRQLG